MAKLYLLRVETRQGISHSITSSRPHLDSCLADLYRALWVKEFGDETIPEADADVIARWAEASELCGGDIGTHEVHEFNLPEPLPGPDAEWMQFALDEIAEVERD